MLTLSNCFMSAKFSHFNNSMFFLSGSTNFLRSVLNSLFLRPLKQSLLSCSFAIPSHFLKHFIHRSFHYVADNSHRNSTSVVYCFCWLSPTVVCWEHFDWEHMFRWRVMLSSRKGLVLLPGDTVGIGAWNHLGCLLESWPWCWVPGSGPRPVRPAGWSRGLLSAFASGNPDLSSYHLPLWFQMKVFAVCICFVLFCFLFWDFSCFSWAQKKCHVLCNL